MFGCEFLITDTGGVKSEGILLGLREKEQEQYQAQLDNFILCLPDSTQHYPRLEDTVVVAYAPAIKPSDSLICQLTGFGFNSIDLKFIAYQNSCPDRHAKLSRRLYRPPTNIYATIADVNCMRIFDGSLLTQADLKGLLSRHDMPTRRLILLEELNGVTEFERANIASIGYIPHTINVLWFVAGGLLIDTAIIMMSKNSQEDELFLFLLLFN